MSDTTLLDKRVLERLSALETQRLGAVTVLADETYFERVVLARLAALEVAVFGSVLAEPDSISFGTTVLVRLANLENGGGAGSTWNAASSNVNYTFSTDYLTASVNAANGNYLVRANKAVMEGYWEAVPTITAGDVNVGFTTAAASTGDWVGHAGVSYEASSGWVLVNNTNIVNYGAFTSGTPIMIAIKQTSAGVYKAFFQKGGVWLGSANPDTNTGGVDVSSVIGTGLYPAVDLSQQGNVVGRFLSGFSNTPPTTVPPVG